MSVETGLLDSQDGCYWLTNGMARSAGVSLPEAIARGDITRADVVRLVDRCQACTKTEACLMHLATGVSVEGPEEDTPAYCLNHEVIDALKSKTAG